MNFWEQFAIIQAQAALHTLIRKYVKYFNSAEMQSLDVVIDALIDLPQRISGPAVELKTPVAVKKPNEV